MKKLLVVFVLICGQLGYAYGQNDNDDSNLVIISPIYDNITNHAGALVVEKNHKKRIMNQSGKSIFPVEFLDDDYIVCGIGNGLYGISRKEKGKRINDNGDMLYSNIIISNDGKTIIPFGKIGGNHYYDKKNGLYIFNFIDSVGVYASYDNDGKKTSEDYYVYHTHEEICDIAGKTLYRQGVDYDDYDCISDFYTFYYYRHPFLLFRNGDEWIYELKEKKMVPWTKFKIKWNSKYCKVRRVDDACFVFEIYGGIEGSPYSTDTRLVYTFDGKEIDGMDLYRSRLPYFGIYEDANGKYKVYNYDLARTIVPLGKYDRCEVFGREELLFVENKGKEGVVNRYGKEIVPVGKYDEIYEASGGLVKVKKEKKYGLINENGDEIVPLGTYDDINKIDFSALVEVEKNNKYGLINNNGQVVLPLEYDEIGKNYPKFIQYGGISIIRKNDKVGAVDANGKIVIPVKYDNFESYFWDYIAFTLDGKTEIYDYKGNLILPLGKFEGYENRFGKLDYLKFHEEWTWSDGNVNDKSGLFIFYKNGKKGVVKLW